MPASAAVDNDVLIKMACYQLLEYVAATIGRSSAIGVLSVARFVVSHRLTRDSTIRNPELALESFNAFLGAATTLDPTDAEITLATELEELASRAGLELDTGESQLCAIVLTRRLIALITGDKRAILSLQAMRPLSTHARELDGLLLGLEQVFLCLISHLGLEPCRGGVCAEPAVDKAMTICFACNSAAATVEDCKAGLDSYIRQLREQAPDILARSDCPKLSTGE